MNAKRLLMAGCLVLSLHLPGQSAAQGPVGGLVVFGTSLSDPGNAYAALGAATTPPDWSVDPFLVPDRPYARGGHHFSNGATWIEQFAGPNGLAASAKGAFTRGGGTNFAFGGARARNFGTSPSLAVQVGLFLQATGGTAPSAPLYVIEMGGNDMRDAVLALAVGQPAEALQILEEALQAIVGSIQTLHAAGARKFLLWNMPNIGATPALSPTPLAGFADSFAQQFNIDLATALSTALSGIDIAVLDVYGKIGAVVAQPGDFGLTNATQACISVEAPFSCAQPNDHLFWDGIHPSAAGHAIIAHEAGAALAR